MIVLVVLGAIFAVNFVVNWIRSDATMDPQQHDASVAAALSFGGLVLICAVATIGQLASPI